MRFLVRIFLFLLIVPPMCAQSSDDSIRELIIITGSHTLAVQMVDLLIPQLQEMTPEVPDEFWQELKSQFDPQGFIDLVIPIYRDHYTNEEILQLIDFYRTPLGQKVIRETPKIMEESYLAGQEWGQQIAAKAILMLIERGYTLPGQE